MLASISSFYRPRHVMMLITIKYYIYAFLNCRNENKRKRKWCSRILQHIPSPKLQIFICGSKNWIGFIFVISRKKEKTNTYLHIQWAAIHPALRTQGKLGEKSDDVSHDIEFNPHNECLNGKSTTIHKHHTNTLKLVHLIYFVM